MTETVSTAVAIPAREGRSHQWIESPFFDLFFLTFAPLLTLSIVIGSIRHVPFVFAIGILLAYPHYISTGAFLLWDENRPYQRSRWIAFAAGPVLIAVLYAALVILDVPFIVQFALFFWTVFHVSLQSCGIASIYRNRASVRDPSQKRATNAAIISTNLWFSLWNLDSHQQIFPVFQSIHPRFTQILWIGAGAVSIVSLIRLAHALRKRAQDGAFPGAAELMFLGTSFLLFHPYLWLHDSNFATYAMLLPHYVQYLGLVWLLHRRKFRQPVGSPLQQVLQRFSASLPLLASTLIGVGLIFWSTRRWSVWNGQGAIWINVSILLAFEHYYLDGLIWAFKQPHVRRTIGPYLLTMPTAVPVSAEG
jgi:hypothetical protein